MSVLIIDNGAAKMKYGFDKDERPQGISSNCTAHVRKQMISYVGDQVDTAINGSLLQYNRPFDHGYLTKMDIELQIWNRLFGAACLKINPADHNLVLTESPFNFESIQNDINEVVFEEYEFPNYLRRVPSWFSAYEFSRNPPQGVQNTDCCTVVDSGFSYTHIMPFIDLKCQKHACKRVDVGGKLLTNYLKELVSFRQWNMMDEFILIDQVKEELCYVSIDMISELKKTKSVRNGARRAVEIDDPFGLPLKRNFVLPDFQSIQRGYVKPHDEMLRESEQLLVMETERFCVPEVLFRPQIVGLEQAGIGEALGQAFDRFEHPAEVGLTAGNILLTGGNMNLPQIEQRLYTEVRPLVPDIFPMQTFKPDRPEEYAWLGARRFVQDMKREHGAASWVQTHMVSRQQYLEHGHNYCNQKFQNAI